MEITKIKYNSSELWIDSCRKHVFAQEIEILGIATSVIVGALVLRYDWQNKQENNQ